MRPQVAPCDLLGLAARQPGRCTPVRLRSRSGATGAPARGDQRRGGETGEADADPARHRCHCGESVALKVSKYAGSPGGARDRPASMADSGHGRRHRRGRVPRLPPLRAPARAGATGSSASTTSRRARSRTSSTSASDEFAFVHHDLDAAPSRSTSRSTSSTTSRAPASPIDYLRLPLHTLKVGSYGTHNALGLAKLKRARFLLASTSEVYGDPQVHPQPESYWGNVNPIGPRGVYDEAKRYAEALTMAYHRQQGVDTAIVRIFNTYGPRMRPHDGRAIPTFVRQALEGEPITVFGDGSQTRSFCYVDDLVRGLHPARRERASTCPVNIGNPTRVHAARARPGRRSGVDGLVERDRVTRRCRWTTPRCASRTSPARAGARLGAGGRSRTGSGGCSTRSARANRRCVERSPPLAAASRRSPSAPACDARPRPRRRTCTSASRTTRSSSTASREQSFPVFKSLHAQVMRRNLLLGVRTASPSAARANAHEPERPGVRLGDSTTAPCSSPRKYGHAGAVHDLRHAGLGQRRRRQEPRADERRPTCRTSRYAAATRYSGTFDGRRTACACRR